MWYRGRGKGEGKCRQPGKQQGKCRECRGEVMMMMLFNCSYRNKNEKGEAAGVEFWGREETKMQRSREKRARTTKPRKKCPQNRLKSQCLDCWGGSIYRKRRAQCKYCGGASICEHNRERSRCKDCRGASNCEHNRHSCVVLFSANLPVCLWHLSVSSLVE